MTQTASSKVILTELKALRKDVTYIKECVGDLFLTPTEERLLEGAEQAHKEGRTLSLEEVRKARRG